MRVARKILFVITCVFPLIGPGFAEAAGQICKWVDAGGRTHFTDSPSPNQPCRFLSGADLPYLNIQAPVAVKTVATHRAAPVRRKSTRRSSKPGADCNTYRDRIAAIEQQLRQGYTEPTGSRLRARKRRWSDLLYQRCY